MISLWQNNKITVLAFLFAITVAAVSHGYNMYKFPYYEDDEGTYMSQAHALFTSGKLAHYAYWYDHAPAGWIFIGLWATVVSPFTSTPFSIDSGRTFMWVLHILSSVLVFLIAKRIRRENLPAVIAVLIFSLSPLAVFNQRRVLLDNICIFWSLLALWLVVAKNRKLSDYILSALAFSIAVLSKEVAVFFAPGLLYAILTMSDKRHRYFAVVMWLGVSFIVGLSYPLYALLNGEFFPSGTLLGGNNPHVSLLDGLTYQTGKAGGYFLNTDSSFMVTFRGWLGVDQRMITDGLICIAIIALIALRVKILRPLILMTVVFWLFFIHGGNIYGFYIIPVVPLMGLMIGLSVQYLLDIPKYIVPFSVPRRAIQFVALGLCVVPYAIYYSHDVRSYQQDETTEQIQAVAWVKANVPTDSVILIDNYAYLDFYGTYDKANYYWKADTDPAIRDGVLQDNWCTVDYLLATPQVGKDATDIPLPLVQKAYSNSQTIQAFPGPYRIDIRKVNKQTCAGTGTGAATNSTGLQTSF